MVEMTAECSQRGATCKSVFADKTYHELKTVLCSLVFRSACTILSNLSNKSCET